MSDNNTTISYINSMGGCKAIECNSLTKHIWDWARERNIWLSAAHIPGSSNVDADRLSRNSNLNFFFFSYSYCLLSNILYTM